MELSNVGKNKVINSACGEIYRLSVRIGQLMQPLAPEDDEDEEDEDEEGEPDETPDVIDLENDEDEDQEENNPTATPHLMKNAQPVRHTPSASFTTANLHSSTSANDAQNVASFVHATSIKRHPLDAPNALLLAENAPTSILASQQPQLRDQERARLPLSLRKMMSLRRPLSRRERGSLVLCLTRLSASSLTALQKLG